MGWWPVTEMTLVRKNETREIVITWKDVVVGDREKRFSFEQAKEALEFAAYEFNSLAM